LKSLDVNRYIICDFHIKIAHKSNLIFERKSLIYGILPQIGYVTIHDRHSGSLKIIKGVGRWSLKGWVRRGNSVSPQMKKPTWLDRLSRRLGDDRESFTHLTNSVK